MAALQKPLLALCSLYQPRSNAAPLTCALGAAGGAAGRAWCRLLWRGHGEERGPLRERRRGHSQPLSGPADSAIAATAQCTSARRAVRAAAPQPPCPGAHAALASARTPTSRRAAAALPRLLSNADATAALIGPSARPPPLCLPATAYLLFPTANREGLGLPAPEHLPLLGILWDEEQQHAPGRLWADLVPNDCSQAGMPLEPLPTLEHEPDWDHLLYGAPPAVPAALKPPPPSAPGAPGEATCGPSHSRVSSMQSSGHGRARMNGGGVSRVARRRRRHGAASLGSRGQRGAAVTKVSRKGHGNKLKAQRLEFGRPDVQAFLRLLAVEQKLSLQKISLVLVERYRCGRYSRFHLSKVFKMYGIPTANGKVKKEH